MGCGLVGDATKKQGRCGPGEVSEASKGKVAGIMELGFWICRVSMVRL